MVIRKIDKINITENITPAIMPFAWIDEVIVINIWRTLWISCCHSHTDETTENIIKRCTKNNKIDKILHWKNQQKKTPTLTHCQKHLKLRQINFDSFTFTKPAWHCCVDFMVDMHFLSSIKIDRNWSHIVSRYSE